MKYGSFHFFNEFLHGSKGLNFCISFRNFSKSLNTLLYIHITFPLRFFVSSLSKKSTRSSSMKDAREMYVATSSRMRSLTAIFKCFLDSGSFEMRLKGVVPLGSWYLKCLLASIIASMSSSFTPQWMTLIAKEV